MITVNITRRVFLVAQPDSEVFVTNLQYFFIKRHCTVMSPSQGDPGKKVKITRKVALTALPGSTVYITERQYKLAKGYCKEAPTGYTVQYQYEFVGAEPPWYPPEPPKSSMHEPGEMVTPASLPEDFDVFFAPSEWYLGETPLDGEFEMPEQDVTLTGYFTFKVSVSYRWTNISDLPASDKAMELLPQKQQYPANSEVEVAEEPDLSGTQFEGWYFDGWYDDNSGEQYTHPDKVTIGNEEEFTFSGKLQLVENAAIYYDWNNWNDFRQYENEARALLPAMTTGEARSQTTVAAAPNLAGTPFEGWTFSGWYTASGAQPLLYPDTINYADYPGMMTRLFGTLTPPGN